jgi:hypothetical protein
MGRYSDQSDGTKNLSFELEWVPFVDGGYDCGGAYWGSPDNLYCAQSETQDVVVQVFLRAKNRAHAMLLMLEQWEGSTFVAETGDLTNQTIKFLEDYIRGETDPEMIGRTEDDICDLQNILDSGAFSHN